LHGDRVGILPAVAVLRRSPVAVPAVAAVLAVVAVAGWYLVLRPAGQVSASAVYHDAPRKAPRVAPPHPQPDRAKIEAEARALGLGSGHARAVEPEAGVVADAGGGPTPEQLAARDAKRGAPSGPSLSELQQELRELKRSVGISGRARVTAAGLAAVPSSVPSVVRAIVDAANKIALLPYRYGGGHSADFRDNAYDCSASVSYALAAGGLLEEPLDSTGFMRWGAPGRGRWVTIYASEGHAFMVVDGLRFDTGNLGGGTRWTDQSRAANGFVVRHPPGL
jgi:cell wall-associated NlpC family hydrolase